MAHLIGFMVGMLVWAALTAYTITNNEPQEPYDLGERLWDFKSDEEKAQIKEDAENEYRTPSFPCSH